MEPGADGGQLGVQRRGTEQPSAAEGDPEGQRAVQPEPGGVPGQQLRVRHPLDDALGGHPVLPQPQLDGETGAHGRHRLRGGRQRRDVAGVGQQEHDGVPVPRGDEDQVDEPPPGDPRDDAVEHQVAAVAVHPHRGWTGTQRGLQRHAGAQPTAAELAEERRAQPGWAGRRQPGDHAQVLQPHERGRQVARGELLDRRGDGGGVGGQAPGVRRSGQPVEAVGGEPVQVRAGHRARRLHRGSRGREQLGGQLTGPGDDAGHLHGPVSGFRR